MSRSIDLFIDMPTPVESVVAEIQRLTSLTLAPGPMPGTWALDEGEVHAELHAHPYVDDGNLLLAQFRWALSCRIGNDVRPVDAPETILLRLVSEALHRGGIPVLLVHDLQYRDRAVAASGSTAGGPDEQA